MSVYKLQKTVQPDVSSEAFWKPEIVAKIESFFWSGTFAKRRRSKIKNPYRLVAPFGFAGGHLPLDDGVKNFKLSERSEFLQFSHRRLGRSPSNRALGIFVSFVARQKKARGSVKPAAREKKHPICQPKNRKPSMRPARFCVSDCSENPFAILQGCNKIAAKSAALAQRPKLL